MSLTLLVAVVLALQLAELAIEGLFLWLGARLAKIPGVKYRRALLASAVIFVLLLLIQGGLWAVLAYWPGGEAPAVVLQFMAAAFALGLCLAVSWLCVRWLLRATAWRAALATLIMLVGGSAASLALVFTFRYSMAEAFVVPSGSMAPTIFGAHADAICDNCGYGYAVNMSDWVLGYSGPVRERVSVLCPNCRQPDALPPTAPILPGDRIVADKIGQPKRWDLIVFRYPEDPSVNYVHRLVGLPGETLEIVAGDVLVDGRRLRKPPGMAVDMWLPVHDTQWVPKQLPPHAPCWKPAGSTSHWKKQAAEWQFAGPDASPEALCFSGPLVDELAYNHELGKSAPLLGDVKVEARIEGLSGDGGLAFRWMFLDHSVTATISTSGTVEIASASRSASGPEDDGTDNTATGTLSGDVSAEQHLAFAFRDGQAYLTQDGCVVACLPVFPDDVQAARDTLREPPEPCRVEIVASRCSVTLSRIALWRDVYYRDMEQMKAPGFAPRWGCTDHPIALGRGQYYVLGDNSARAKDSRFWGTVASDQIIGVVRCTYWPPSRWHEFR